MSVKINIVDQDTEQVPAQDEGGVKIEIIEKDEINFKLMTRSAINGDIMILDHKDIDIVLKQGEGKILTFAKETLSDYTYGAEARQLEFMRSKGVLEYEKVNWSAFNDNLVVALLWVLSLSKTDKGPSIIESPL